MVEYPSSYFEDLSSWLQFLDNNGMLYRIKSPIVKETELSSLVRLQFRGLPEEERKGFLFENVVDVKGRKYDSKVATGVYASSLKMYAMGLMSEQTRQSIQEKWTAALLNPIEPKLVSDGPVQQVVYSDKELLEDGKGIEALPVPVDLPGFSGQIRSTTHVISKHPESGWRNMGNYSGHIFAKDKILWEIGTGQHGYQHWQEWKKLGKPMPIAIVIGGPPTFFYLAGAKLQHGVDELGVAGAFARKPIELVKCKTIDLEVPAHAEIVVEGLASVEYMEPGNAFGEFTGYMATDVQLRPIIKITAVTHRLNPTFVHIISQFPPSESSGIRKFAYENTFVKFLKHDCRLPGILDVAWHEISQAQWCVIKIKKVNKAHPWQVLNCAAGYDARQGKYFIVVDDDIDIQDMDSVIWALSWRTQPDRDTRLINARQPGLDISAYKADDPYEQKIWPNGVGASAMLIDATLKHPYPPTSLPSKEFMEKALEIWKREGLPELNLKYPWFGYELGYWPNEYREDARLVVKGDHYVVGKRLEKARQKV